MTTTTTPTHAQRMTNPALVLPDAGKGIGHLIAAIGKGGLPASTVELIGIRVSQLNGCTACLHSHWDAARSAGVEERQLISVTAWHESPYFDEGERAALALADAMTRMADAADAVPDELWGEVAEYYDEEQLAALVLQIATMNLFNRLNVTVRESVEAPFWLRG
jgi:AhpD family alkylhydroperoxidase